MKKPAAKIISDFFPDFAVHSVKRDIINSMASTAPQNTAAPSDGERPSNDDN
jgi:hypothetical protein